MPNSSTERRKTPRAAVHIKAQVQILFPEVTFSPIILDGTISDLSVDGARVKVVNLTNKDYIRILQGPRLCRLVCTFTGAEFPSRLFGKILNFEIRGKMAEGGHCILGINFGENEEHDQNALREFLIATGSVATESTEPGNTPQPF
ncbi:PilZ domain-containing protein [Candidatus Sumerlaeota bacterium]|nr:PilZ domain-containing protein [Candidatus Sumerlaeota bacterium]